MADHGRHIVTAPPCVGLFLHSLLSTFSIKKYEGKIETLTNILRKNIKRLKH
jgi:hypothetical protein